MYLFAALGSASAASFMLRYRHAQFLILVFAIGLVLSTQLEWLVCYPYLGAAGRPALSDHLMIAAFLSLFQSVVLYLCWLLRQHARERWN